MQNDIRFRDWNVVKIIRDHHQVGKMQLFAGRFWVVQFGPSCSQPNLPCPALLCSASGLDPKRVGIRLTFCHLWDSATMKPWLEIEAMQRSILQAQHAVVTAAADLWYDGKDGMEWIRLWVVSRCFDWGPCDLVPVYIQFIRCTQSPLGGLPNRQTNHCRNKHRGTATAETGLPPFNSTGGVRAVVDSAFHGAPKDTQVVFRNGSEKHILKKNTAGIWWNVQPNHRNHALLNADQTIAVCSPLCAVTTLGQS